MNKKELDALKKVIKIDKQINRAEKRKLMFLQVKEVTK